MHFPSTLTLHGRIPIPRLGLGVYQSGRATGDAVRRAIEAGCRHFDTAAMYGNETDIGVALRQAFAAGQVRREKAFVSTKLWNSDHGYDEALRAFASASRLGLD
jgi:diketogulonate reductase-like aldo/keto reductase